jgi:hypothetical protein
MRLQILKYYNTKTQLIDGYVLVTEMVVSVVKPSCVGRLVSPSMVALLSGPWKMVYLIFFVIVVYVICELFGVVL